MKFIKKKNWYIPLLLVAILICSSFVFSNSILKHYLYAIVEAPSCTSHIMETINNKEASYKSVGEYVEANVKPGMSKKDVHEVLENISPISISKSGNFEEIVLLMCSVPLNNLVYSAEYDDKNKLIDFQYEDFP